MPRVQFLGTGNAFAPHGRMHALALIDGCILIDAPPTLLPQLRRAAISPAEIEHLLFTHWHADHIFGFPFLILERQHVSDAAGERILDVHLRPSGREILSELCRMGFPGSLEAALEERIDWHQAESGVLAKSGWRFERFPVCHTPETDPHGYELIHQSGFRFLHCGDSGPCEGIESRAARANVILVEMGVPDFVQSPHHHTPSDVIAIAERHPEAMILVTHNFASGTDETEGFDLPDLPEEIRQLEDGDVLDIISKNEFFIVRK